jgi:hypothetical protein
MEKDYNLVIRGNVPNARGMIHPTAIKNMATNDRDFERIEWIKIWKP